MITTTLQTNLRRLMRAKGLKQKGLALDAGLNETAVRDILKGRAKRPLHTTIIALSKALDCAPGDLIDGWKEGEREKVRSALESILVGGNHLASMLVKRLGASFASEYPPDMDDETALRRLHATDTHEIWVAWSRIMRARDVFSSQQAAT